MAGALKSALALSLRPGEGQKGGRFSSLPGGCFCIRTANPSVTQWGRSSCVISGSCSLCIITVAFVECKNCLDFELLIQTADKEALPYTIYAGFAGPSE